MGSVMSLSASRKRTREHEEIYQAESYKRLKVSLSGYDKIPRLIPSLPDELSLQILARLPRIYYLNAKSVSRSWKAAITSPELFKTRRELGTTEAWLYILTKIGEHRLQWHALDLASRKWQRLPPMPDSIYEEESKARSSRFRMRDVFSSGIRAGEVIKDWLVRRNRWNQMLFCGCSVAAIGGCLYLLGGFSRDLAMKCVWRYDPSVNLWQKVSPMTTPRAFCKTGLLNNKLYAVGGVSKGRTGLEPLQSAEVFDPLTGLWAHVPSMPFLKAHELPTALLADMFKPIATGMATYKGMLYVPQSLYSWPFFVDIGGEVYDPQTDSWVEMSYGMGEDWPARQAGMKLSVVVDGELYSLEPTSSLDSGKIQIYDHKEDAWKVIVENVPIHDFIHLECPYLLAGFHGKLLVITKDENKYTAILQTDVSKYVSSSPGTSSSPPANSTPGIPLLSVEEERDVWSVIDSKDLGPGELVGCQLLDV